MCHCISVTCSGKAKGVPHTMDRHGCAAYTASFSHPNPYALFCRHWCLLTCGHWCLLTARSYGCRIKSVLATPWLLHLGILKLQDNLITHMSSLPSLPFLETLDLSFNHITHLSVVQTLASFQHLRSLRVNDNPVQHEPHFYFSLQRLMPWTQHEFGHARHFPTDQQITQIQQEAVLNSPEALQACRQEQWGIRAAAGLSHAFSPPAVPGKAPAREGEPLPALVRPSLRWPAGGVQDGSGGGVSNGTAAHRAGITRQGLVMLEGAARRLRQAQVCIPPAPWPPFPAASFSSTHTVQH